MVSTSNLHRSVEMVWTSAFAFVYLSDQRPWKSHRQHTGLTQAEWYWRKLQETHRVPTEPEKKNTKRFHAGMFGKSQLFIQFLIKYSY